jgi:spore cortex biosynthesis protein YabQ
MNNLVSNQAFIFLVSVAGGLIIAFIYDIFRIFRKTIKAGDIITYIQDLIFWMLVAIIIFAMVYISNEGKLRGYIFIGITVGAVLYSLLLSNIVMKSAMLIIKIVSFPIKVLIKILSVPAAAIVKVSASSARLMRRVSRNRFSRAGIYGKFFKKARKKI